MSYKMYTAARISVCALLLHNGISSCGIRVASIDEWQKVVEKALQLNLLSSLGGKPYVSPADRLVATSILCASLEKLVPVKEQIHTCIKLGKPVDSSFDWCEKEVSQARNSAAQKLMKKHLAAAPIAQSEPTRAFQNAKNSRMHNRGIYASHKPLKQELDGRCVRGRKHHRVDYSMCRKR
jgi:hypothetical protein